MIDLDTFFTSHIILLYIVVGELASLGGILAQTAFQERFVTWKDLYKFFALFIFVGLMAAVFDTSPVISLFIGFGPAFFYEIIMKAIPAIATRLVAGFVGQVKP